ncbi:MAG: hypothetical protein ONB51_05465 [candidate division KSB1 bacterium]|nr:hypothetical protein [candidate division KSB1 bacterium]
MRLPLHMPPLPPASSPAGTCFAKISSLQEQAFELFNELDSHTAGNKLNYETASYSRE